MGQEKDFNEYLDKLIAIFAEVKRVMKKSATCFVNLGDTYGGSWGNYGSREGKQRSRISEHWHRPGYENGRHDGRPPSRYLKQKSLCQIPERFSIRMTDELGFIKRNNICWTKGNPMPSSVKDRMANTWEPLMFFVKIQRYFFDLDAIREKFKYPERTYNPDTSKHKAGPTDNRNIQGLHDGRAQYGNPNTGRNPGDVWKINTQPFSDYYCPTCDVLRPGRKLIKIDDVLVCPVCKNPPLSHFAMFPEKLVERPVLAGTPEWICRYCGKAWERVVEKNQSPHNATTESRYGKGSNANRISLMRQAARARGEEYQYQAKTISWTTCDCDLPEKEKWRPGIVLDPFVGAGTTLLVAHKLRRSAIGIDLSRDYCRMARKRLQPYLQQGVLV